VREVCLKLRSQGDRIGRHPTESQGEGVGHLDSCKARQSGVNAKRKGCLFGRWKKGKRVDPIQAWLNKTKVWKRSIVQGEPPKEVRVARALGEGRLKLHRKTCLIEIALLQAKQKTA